jgi:ubiquinone/menaquinone biosynthesis C-methylase UbiE
MEKYIKLYNGNLPLPYEDNSFKSGVCIEVLEHIPNFEDVIKELARIIESCLVISVPDISSIPLLHKHNVVPWHLLESTHVNFFTQVSLYGFLKKYFTRINFAKIGCIDINSTKSFTSIVAICYK